MTDPLARAAVALDAARALWAEIEVADSAVDGYSGSPLIALNEAIAELRMRVDAAHAHVAARIARALRAELGNAGLARQEGFRSPASLIAAATGDTIAAGARLIRVGEATETPLTGDTLPPRHPAVADALGAGVLGIPAAAAIVALLDRVALRVPTDAMVEAEETLVRQATGLSLEQVHRILQRAEAWLDPDGIELREDDLRAECAAHIREDRRGFVRLTATLDPESGAPVKVALEGFVGSRLRARAEGGGLAADEHRTIPQLQAEALAAICRHALGCDAADVPTGGATVVVRVPLDQLASGLGHATVDGLAQPISISAARRMAADGAIIPWVLGGDSEILDLGRSRRLFGAAQKLALVERDGGCAMCGLPPGMAQVHHIRWWERDAGPTDLANGILLCVRCHHRIHDDGWEIRIEGAGVRASVWFVPPRHVDPARTPRLGGRARFDYREAS